MSLKCLTKSKWLKPVQKNAGQVVIEYVLLLVVVSSLGAIIIRDLVSRKATPEESGILVAKWHSILRVIAEDNPEE